MRRALVIGGSLGGLIAAHLLRSIGWDAVVFERNRRGTGEPRCRARHASAAHRHSARAGIAFDETMGIQLRKAVCLDRDGNDVVEQPTTRITERLVAALPRIARRVAGADIGSAKGSFASNRTARTSRRISPTARASTATCWSAPTASAPRSARNICRRSNLFMPAMSPGGRCSTKPRCRAISGARCSISTRSVCRKASN